MPLFRLESWRVIVEKRADGNVETEATIKIWVPSGEAGVERRFVSTAEGNGPVNALDNALRAAIGEVHPHLREIELVNYKVRILDESKGTGAITRVLARRLRRPARLGLDRGLREPDRGLLGRAGGFARVRDAAADQGDAGAEGHKARQARQAGRALLRGGLAKRQAPRRACQARSALRRAQVTGGAPGAGGSPARSSTIEPEPIPLAAPVLGAAEERALIDVLRSGQLSLGERLPEFERAFAERVGAPYASAVSSGTAGLHLALRAVGVSDGDEVVTTPFSFVASANVILYERAIPVFADIDARTLNIDPDAAAAAVGERTRALLPVHAFGYPADMAALERVARQSGLGIVEDACEALGGHYADGRAIGGRGHPSVFGFYPNKQLTTGEGGMVTLADGALKELIDSERNQGRSPDMGWLDHDRLGFNYRLSELACALGLAQLERLEDMLAARAHVAALYREALGELEDVELPCADAGDARRGWFVFVVQLPREADREQVIAALARERIQSKPYLPAIHLMSFYRERFGYSEGQFPVCEEVASRSLALPFFPAMGEREVERVAIALRGALAR